MKLVPDNGFLLVREIETPTFSDIANSVIVGDHYIFGNVLDHSEGTDDYLCCDVMFSRAASISLRMKNDQGEIEDRHLVHADAIVATIGRE
jgi:hypothetical protein